MDFTRQFVGFCWIAFLLYWIVAAFSVKRTLEKQNAGQRVLTTAAILAAFLLMRRGGQFEKYGDIALWQHSLASGLVADMVALAGLVVAFWARATLGSNWSANVTFKEGHELIQRGPYHYVRHPIYSGVLLMVLGSAILYGRLFGFLAIVLVFLAIRYKFRQEEKLMTRHFPDVYPGYKAHVKALIPFLF